MIGDYTDFPMSFPSVSQVSRSTRPYHHWLPRHHSRLPDRYSYINEEVFVSQPPVFEDHKNPEHVYMFKKALYGLKQAPRQWYERLS